MKRNLLSLPIILLSILFLAGCSTSGSEAPGTGPGSAVHPSNWISLHSGEANTDLRGCQGCHGFDFAGSGEAVSCFTCHLSGPPFVGVHSSTWANVINDHQGFPNDFNWTTCAAVACHGSNLQGGAQANGPSCFNNTASCHSGTAGDPPAPASHQAVDFTDPDNHGSLAKAGQVYCRNCHGRSLNVFDGGFIADPAIMNNLDYLNNPVTGACSTCHPSALAHPTDWQGSNDADPTYAASHRGIDETTQANSCALCHNIASVGAGPTLDEPGSVAAAPSCFSTSYANANAGGVAIACHPGGPRTANHPLGAAWRDYSNTDTWHGAVAKDDLTACQACHADSGSPPRFNSPIGGLANGCEDCHDPYYAHPTDWAGPNTTFHYSVTSTESCKLCHGTGLDGVGGVDAAGGTPGLSCLNCHAEVTYFTLDCASCHSYPPLTGDTIDTSVFPAGAQLVDHTADTTGGTVADKAPHDECATCHGVKNAAGSLTANANYLLFDKATDTLGSHWNGSLEMNGPSSADPSGGADHVGAGYNSVSHSCDNAGCHGPGYALSDSNMPVAFADFGVGSGHDIGQAWLLTSGHVADATAPSPNCFSCHAQSGASPVSGAPACQDCHVNGNPLTGLSCASCHGTPPNSNTTVLTDRPNRAGKHGKHNALTVDTLDCSACHSGGGSDSLTHFDRTASTTPNYPADVQFLGTAYNSQGSTAQYNGSNQCQNVLCHGGVTTPSWYTGSIDVYGGGSTACRQCHSSTGEYNAYSSGRHSLHVGGENISCLPCHNTTVLQNGVAGNSHFSGLKTTGFELDPAATLNSSLNYNGTSCNPACHGSENWR